MREQMQRLYTQWIGTTIGGYRLEQLIGQSVLGPVFAAQQVTTQTPAYLRILDVPPAETAAALAAYEAPLERQAGHIATLRHPYILPLISYGLEQGLPYLVWPYPAMRSLTARLAQSGPLDVVTVGRYLDQIAAALEYAHEHATIHRNLSTDCIYLQLDGQPVIADFGVRRLFELLGASSGSGLVPRFYGSVEACAPEQLLGAQAEAYTDVYALGAITYRLLTGQPPFNGDSFEALAQRHLRAAPPPLAQWRSGLPPALDEVLQTALAKVPARRFQHPGELANAYHRVIDAPGTRRVPFASPSQPSGAPAALAERGSASQISRGGRSSVLPHTAAGGGAPKGPAGDEASPSPPRDASTRRSGITSRGRILAAALLLLVLVGGGLALLVERQQAAAVPGGTISFRDSPNAPVGSTDALQISARGLADPPSGAHYQAWFINQTTEQILALGPLVAHANQTYTLSYAATPTNSVRTQNLLALGSAFEITLERSAVEAPAGKVVLSAAFPPDAFVHIKHVLLSFPTTPGTIGLLVGVVQQTDAVNREAKALRQAMDGSQSAAVRCHAQSLLDTLEGSHGQHYQPLSAACVALGITPVADGFGLLDSSATAGTGQYPQSTGYIADAADHASLAAATPDATPVIHQQAAVVQTLLAGVKSSLTEADAAALRLRAAPPDAGTAAALADDCARAYGTAGRGSTDAAGATGALGAYLHGQLMATVSLG